MTDQSLDGPLLGPAEIRELAERAGIRPTKTLGQNFVIDPNTIRRIVATAHLTSDEHVLEVGPGLGSLTLGLLAASAVFFDSRRISVSIAGARRRLKASATTRRSCAAQAGARWR